MPCAHADNCGIDADDLAGRGHQRPAGIARVQGRVGLDHAVDQPARAGAQRPAEGADDAGRDRALKAERVADRHHQLADPQLPRIAEPGEGRGVAVEPQYREIGVGIVADQARAKTAAVGKGGLDLARARHDVAIGQDIGVGGEDHARAGAAGSILGSGHLQVEDRRADLVDGADDGAGVSIEQRHILGRRARRGERPGLAVAAEVADW